MKRLLLCALFSSPFFPGCAGKPNQNGDRPVGPPDAGRMCSDTLLLPFPQKIFPFIMILTQTAFDKRKPTERRIFRSPGKTESVFIKIGISGRTKVRLYASIL